MEAAFVNVVRAGDTVVVGVNGVFGERMCDVAARCGAEVVRGSCRSTPQRDAGPGRSRRSVRLAANFHLSWQENDA